MIEQTIEKLKEMRLSTFARALCAQMESSQYSAMTFDERLSFLVDEEFLARENRRLERNLRQAKLKQSVSVEDIDFDTPRGLKRTQIMEFAECNWITQNHSLIITGPTGAGKSFLACALGDKACKLGLKVHYTKTSDLARKLVVARADGSYPTLINRLVKTQLLIVDEWLRDPLDQELARELLDLIDDRFRKASFIFISQLPVADWHKHIDDPTLADAILDRVIHDSHRVALSGESMRKQTALVGSKVRQKTSLRSD